MAKTSAGVLAYRGVGDSLEVFLVHPGGPVWARKDAGVWSIPKGEIDGDEPPEVRARIEFHEETGIDLGTASLVSLGEVRQKAGKLVIAYALARDIDPAACSSNTFTTEWPPRSGRTQAFPEVDRWAWFDLVTARVKLNPAQVELLDRLQAKLRG